jgi:branched-chain amino acid transport system substrate-binding protein
MKKSLILILALSLAVMGFAGCGRGGVGTDTSKTIKIGVFEPTTGENGGGGQLEVDGMTYANSKRNTVNIGGEDYKIELVIVDNKSDKAEAANAANYLVNSKVSVVLGSYGSGVSIAAGSIFADAEIPAIGASCTNPQVTLGNDYYFRVCFLDSFQAKVLAKHAIDEGYRKAAVLTQIGDDYSIGLGTFFEDAYKNFGGQIVSAQNFPANNSDFNALLQNIKSSGAQVVFAPSSITIAPVIFQQAKALGITAVFMGADTWDNAEMVAAAGDAAEGIVASTFFNDEDDSVADFVNGYKSYSKSDSINVVTALGYDAYMTAVDAIEAAQSTKGSDIRNALVNVSRQGVTGEIKFDKNGDVSKDSAVIKTVKDGKLTYFNTVSVADVK